MKLELKHIAPYLPYGLKVKIIPISNLYEEQVTTVDCISNEFVTFKKAPDFYFIDEEPDIYFKTILRPLSDLRSHYDKYRAGIYSDFEYYIGCIKTRDMEYAEFECLFEQHFDVFGLIDAGLAIDINKLTQQP